MLSRIFISYPFDLELTMKVCCFPQFSEVLCQRQYTALALCFVVNDAFWWPPRQPYEEEDGAGGVIPFYR